MPYLMLYMRTGPVLLFTIYCLLLTVGINAIDNSLSSSCLIQDCRFNLVIRVLRSTSDFKARRFANKLQ